MAPTGPVVPHVVRVHDDLLLKFAPLERKTDDHPKCNTQPARQPAESCVVSLLLPGQASCFSTSCPLLQPKAGVVDGIPGNGSFGGFSINSTLLTISFAPSIPARMVVLSMALGANRAATNFLLFIAPHPLLDFQRAGDLGVGRLYGHLHWNRGAALGLHPALRLGMASNPRRPRRFRDRPTCQPPQRPPFNCRRGHGPTVTHPSRYAQRTCSQRVRCPRGGSLAGGQPPMGYCLGGNHGDTAPPPSVAVHSWRQAAGVRAATGQKVLIPVPFQLKLNWRSVSTANSDSPPHSPSPFSNGSSGSCCCFDHYAQAMHGPTRDALGYPSALAPLLVRESCSDYHPDRLRSWLLALS